jgi:hypothetical protein
MVEQQLFSNALHVVLHDPAVKLTRVSDFLTVLLEEPQRVIRGAYRRADDGCVVWFLTGVESRGQRVEFFGDRPAGEASQQVVHLWDSGDVSHAELSSLVQAFLADHAADCPPQHEPVLRDDSLQESAATSAHALAS